jgi:hypothetical protein
MSRTLQDQLTSLVATPRAGDAPERDKSELRRMANRSGYDPSLKPALETVVDVFTGKLDQWFQSETQKNIRRARGWSELLKRTGR